MLYKFKSKAAGDLIMLEPNGRQLLQIIGKPLTPQGIIQPPEMATAIQALESAMSRDEEQQKKVDAEAQARGEKAQRAEGISLRQRVVPFVDMLHRAEQAGEDIVWGV